MPSSNYVEKSSTVFTIVTEKRKNLNLNMQLEGKGKLTIMSPLEPGKYTAIINSQFWIKDPVTVNLIRIFNEKIGTIIRKALPDPPRSREYPYGENAEIRWDFSVNSGYAANITGKEKVKVKRSVMFRFPGVDRKSILDDLAADIIGDFSGKFEFFDGAKMSILYKSRATSNVIVFYRTIQKSKMGPSTQQFTITIDPPLPGPKKIKKKKFEFAYGPFITNKAAPNKIDTKNIKKTKPGMPLISNPTKLVKTIKNMMSPSLVTSLKNGKQLPLPILIDGYADSRGKFKENKNLSEKRAQAITKLLSGENYLKPRRDLLPKGRGEKVPNHNWEKGCDNPSHRIVILSGELW